MRFTDYREILASLKGRTPARYESIDRYCCGEIRYDLPRRRLSNDKDPAKRMLTKPSHVGCFMYSLIATSIAVLGVDRDH